MIRDDQTQCYRQSGQHNISRYSHSECDRSILAAQFGRYIYNEFQNKPIRWDESLTYS